MKAILLIPQNQSQPIAEFQSDESLAKAMALAAAQVYARQTEQPIQLFQDNKPFMKVQPIRTIKLEIMNYEQMKTEYKAKNKEPV